MNSFWKKLVSLFGKKKTSRKDLKEEWEKFQKNDPNKLPKPKVGKGDN